MAEQSGQPVDAFIAAQLASASDFSRERRVSGTMALAMVHAEIRRAREETQNFPKTFLCDGGLGGLARWLRAAGYEADWKPELADAAIIAEAQKIGATLITTDTMMMERGVLRDGHLPAVCVPSSLTCEDQLIIVFRELNLPLRDSRCMACGGALAPVSKARVADRVPPRTAVWLDDYFLCTRCNQLFWRGTHWKNIMQKLQELHAGTFS